MKRIEPIPRSDNIQVEFTAVQAAPKRLKEIHFLERIPPRGRRQDLRENVCCAQGRHWGSVVFTRMLQGVSYTPQLLNLLFPLLIYRVLIQCVPITRKLRNAAGRISVYSVITLIGAANCSESVTVEIKKVHVGVIFLRAQFSSFFFFLTSNVHY
jgi:hypothetical protein